MKKLILISSVLGLMACGSSSGQNNVPVSKLIGTWYFSGSLVATVQISSSGTFTLIESFPKNCVESGTYIDNNLGSNIGTITVTDIADSCAPIGKYTDNYTIANGTLVLN